MISYASSSSVVVRPEASASASTRASSPRARPKARGRPAPPRRRRAARPRPGTRPPSDRRRPRAARPRCPWGLGSRCLICQNLLRVLSIIRISYIRPKADVYGVYNNQSSYIVITTRGPGRAARENETARERTGQTNTTTAKRQAKRTPRRLRAGLRRPHTTTAKRQAAATARAFV